MLTETVFHDDEEHLEFAWDGPRFAGVLKTLICEGRKFMVQAHRPDMRPWLTFSDRETAIQFLALNREG